MNVFSPQKLGFPAGFRIHGYLQRSYGRPLALAIACAAYALVVASDYSSTELSVAPFYLLLVLYVSWTCGRVWGVFFAVLCATTEISLGWILAFDYSWNVYLYLNVLSRALAYALVVFLTSALRIRYEIGEHSARHDFVTGALAPRAFYEALGAELARQRRSRKALSVAYIDCDHFKAVNDRRGHAEGDELLRSIVNTARTKFRQTDTIARLGGDEFGLILPDTDSAGAARAIGELRQALRAAMDSNGWDVGFSIGVGTFVCVDASPEELVSICDALMYEAKRQGKDRLVQREYGALDCVSALRNLHFAQDEAAMGTG